MLKSPTTAGLRDVDGVLVEGTMPAVLDRPTWDKVAAVLGDPDRNRNGNNAPVHLLTGIVTCAQCGTPMATKPHKAGSRYVCAPRKGYDACQGVSIDGTKTDDLISAAIVHSLDSPAVRKAMQKPERSRADVLAGIDDDLAAVALEFGEGRLSRREWQAARVALETRRSEAEANVSRVSHSAAVRKLAGARDIGKAWVALDVHVQRTILRVLADTVTVAPAVPGRQFDADRIDIAWKA